MLGSNRLHFLSSLVRLLGLSWYGVWEKRCCQNCWLASFAARLSVDACVDYTTATGQFAQRSCTGSRCWDDRALCSMLIQEGGDLSLGDWLLGFTLTAHCLAYAVLAINAQRFSPCLLNLVRCSSTCCVTNHRQLCSEATVLWGLKTPLPVFVHWYPREGNDFTSTSRTEDL
jgi:hypothetical protein